MSYKFSTGSLRQGDIYYEDDRLGEPTYIDFGMDAITLRPSGSQILHAQADAVGIGTTSPTEILTLNATEPSILFQEAGTDMATIGVNSSDNILIENKTMNKHIVFKVNDQGAVKEGFRLDGAVPEVVVNQTSDSLVDFRVESDNQTHMVFVDGSADKVGISTGTPHSGLQIDNSLAFAARTVTQNHTVTAGDHTIFANAASTNITVTLPSAANIIGRQYIIKRVDTAGTAVTIATNGSETIDGASSMALSGHRSVVIQSDNSNWWIMAEYISPP